VYDGTEVVAGLLDHETAVVMVSTTGIVVV